MVSIFTQEVSFPFRGKRTLFLQAVKDLIKSEGYKVGDLNIVFCSDPFILDLNSKFLDHHYCTDVIGFDYCSKDYLSRDVMNGEIYISVDTVYENAQAYGIDQRLEMMRVVFHGILHFCGYKDDTPEAKAKMTEREDHYIKLLNFCTVKAKTKE